MLCIGDKSPKIQFSKIYAVCTISHTMVSGAGSVSQHFEFILYFVISYIILNVCLVLVLPLLVKVWLSLILVLFPL